MFGSLFGEKKKKKKKSHNTTSSRSALKTPNLNDSIKQLRDSVVRLDKREEHLQKKIQICINTAKTKSKKRDKKGALYELKKKKMLEAQLISIQGKKLNLETQIMSLEDAHLNKQTLEAMRSSAEAMKETMKIDDIEKVDDVLEDINEQMDMVREVDEALQQPLGQVMDDDELLEELEGLEDLEADELMHDMAMVPQKNIGTKFDANVMPDVPDGAIKAKDEEAELAELEAMMMVN